MRRPAQVNPDLWYTVCQRAVEMRHQPTPAEAVLWQAVRRDRFPGFPFRRQHLIPPFIVDFYCPRARLVIEVDGDVHLSQRAYDATRTEYLNALGLVVVRFENGDVLGNVNGVLLAIDEAIHQAMARP